MKKISLLAFVSIISVLLSAQTYTGKQTVSPQEKLNNEYCTGLFKTYDGTIFDLQNENSSKAYLNILGWLQGRVAGLQVYYQKDRTPVAFIRNTKASIYLDEILVDPEFLSFLPVSDIAMIKIIKGPFAGAVGNGPGGVIAIYTLKGEDEEEDIDDN